MTSGPIVLSRRQALRAAVLAAGAGVTAAATSALAGSAEAAPLPAGSAAAAGVVPALADLPSVYGTPTDIARTTELFVWTMDRDGLVLRFDRDQDIWLPAANQNWTQVVGSGEAKVARWGRPGGPNQVVLVLGSDPEPPPPTIPTDPTTPTTPTTPTDPTTPTTPTDPTTTRTAPSVVTTASRNTQPYAAPPAGGRPDGSLSYTGVNLGRLGLIAAGLLAAGGALVALRRRRMAPPEPTVTDPAVTDGPGTAPG